MNQKFDNIYQHYKRLLLNKDEGSIVFWLHYQIQEGDIGEEFTRRDIENAIREVTNLSGNQKHRTGNIIRHLSHYFIEIPPKNKSKDTYRLTEYAKRFITLAEGKLYNHLKSFSLRTVFKEHAYDSFDVEAAKNIQKFREWFTFRFDTESKQSIIDHLEALKDELKQYIKELNDILHQQEKGAIFQVEQFVEVFKQLGKKAADISYTLRLGNQLADKIESVVDSYYDKVNSFKVSEIEKEQHKLNQLKNDYQKAKQIKAKVSTFFKTIEEKLEQAQDSITYASTKLNDLHNNFHYQSQFKRNSYNLLKLALTEAVYARTEPQLPEDFPRKRIPCETIKFITIPESLGKFFTPPPTFVQEIPINKDYEKREWERNQKQQELQKKIDDWVAKCKQILDRDKQIDFTTYFYHILVKEKNSQIPVEVGYSLFHFVTQKDQRSQYILNITKEILPQFQNEKILVWNMKIKKK